MSDANSEIIEAAVASFSSLTRGNAKLEAEGKTWAQLVTNFSTLFPADMEPKMKRQLAHRNLKKALDSYYGKDCWVTPKLDKQKGAGKTVWVFVKDTPGYEKYLREREARHAVSKE